MNESQLLIYQAPDGMIQLDVRLENETVWLTQEQMVKLFGKAKSTINEHVKNVFSAGELVEPEVMKKFGISEFQQKAPNFYNWVQVSGCRCQGAGCWVLGAGCRKTTAS